MTSRWNELRPPGVTFVTRWRYAALPFWVARKLRGRMDKPPKWMPLAAGTLLCAALVLLVLIGHRAQSDHGPQADARSDMPLILRLLH
jgi:hypothetical protein